MSTRTSLLILFIVVLFSTFVMLFIVRLNVGPWPEFWLWPALGGLLLLIGWAVPVFWRRAFLHQLLLGGMNALLLYSGADGAGQVLINAGGKALIPTLSGNRPLVALLLLVLWTVSLVAQTILIYARLRGRRQAFVQLKQLDETRATWDPDATISGAGPGGAVFWDWMNLLAALVPAAGVALIYLGSAPFKLILIFLGLSFWAVANVWGAALTLATALAQRAWEADLGRPLIIKDQAK